MKEKEIRAVYDEETITVYQAYRPAIALRALKYQKFVSPFKLTRMSWIKPSFLWMMYRSGWGKKEGQEHVLAVKIKRSGWEWALKHACLSHFSEDYYESHEAWKKLLEISPVRIQWDPEKDIHLEKMDYKSIQVGLSGEAIEKYANDWVIAIEDITPKCSEIFEILSQGKEEQATQLLPKEGLYPISDEIKEIIKGS